MGTESIRKDWLAGNATESAFFDSLSVHIPEAERFVMRAVHDAYPLIHSADVQTQADALLLEERAHSAVHDGYNEEVRARGYEFSTLERFEKGLSVFFTKHTDVRTRLAICMCIEHFTAVMSVSLLNARILEEAAADTRVTDVWRWHAAEEYGHRGTASHIYHDVRGGYPRRVLAMLVVTAFFFYAHVRCFRSFLRQSGAKKNSAADAFLFGRRGVYPTLISGWAAFFAPGFDPQQTQPVRLPSAEEHAAREARVFAQFGL